MYRILIRLTNSCPKLLNYSYKLVLTPRLHNRWLDSIVMATRDELGLLTFYPEHTLVIQVMLFSFSGNLLIRYYRFGMWDIFTKIYCLCDVSRQSCIYNLAYHEVVWLMQSCQTYQQRILIRLVSSTSFPLHGSLNSLVTRFASHCRRHSLSVGGFSADHP